MLLQKIIILSIYTIGNSEIEHALKTVIYEFLLWNI